MPEVGSYTRPVPVREPARILAQQLMNGILIPPGARGGTILDPASGGDQNTEAENRRQAQTAQTDRWCVSRTWARSSSFSLRVAGVSSA